MADLLMANVDSSASDDEIKAFLVKYGFPPFDSIEHLPGDGSRPSVRLTFKDAGEETLHSLEPRVQDIYWKNRKIHVHVMTPRYG